MKANFGQNQMANETYNLRKFCFLKIWLTSFKKLPEVLVLRSRLTNSLEIFPLNFVSVSTKLLLSVFQSFSINFGIYSGERKK